MSLAWPVCSRFIPLDDESTEEEKVLRAMVEEEAPLRDLDGAIEDVVGTVLELADLGRIEKFKVTQVKRDGGKLGRNDPCHCGSGKGVQGLPRQERLKGRGRLRLAAPLVTLARRVPDEACMWLHRRGHGPCRRTKLKDENLSVPGAFFNPA